MFRWRVEAIAPQICYRLLELFDVQCLVIQCGAVRHALPQQQRLQRLHAGRPAIFTHGSQSEIGRSSAAWRRIDFTDSPYCITPPPAVAVRPFAGGGADRQT